MAKLLHQLKELQAAQAPHSPKILTARNEDFSTPSPLSKKDRKVAKKAAKIADMPKVITTADIDFVANILHPCATDSDAAQEEEQRLLEDPDIILNLYYHKGTSNTREIRYRHLKHKQADGNIEIDIEASDLDALMVALKVPDVATVGTEAERRVIRTLREAVRDDMIKMQKEHEQTVMRKAGFWRWASRKAYDRLMANGSIWEQKGESSDVTKRKDSVFSAESNGDAEEVDTINEGVNTPESTADTTDVIPKSEPRHKVTSPRTPTFCPRSVSGDTAGQAEDKWTTVGRSKPIKKLVGTLKLFRNGGLDKFELKRDGKFGALGSFDRDAIDA
ncbi:hypothetical protein LTR08_007462 [Meristemomyces frigidus]|nr:hypothetical protein LTR08_007462 [Meristemomyces frigidus]